MKPRIFTASSSLLLSQILERDGWFLHIVLPSGEFQEFWASSLKKTVQFAAREFQIPPTSWKRMRKVNLDWILFHFRDASSSLEQLVWKMESESASQKNPPPPMSEHQSKRLSRLCRERCISVGRMRHVYHHLNFAWNTRHHPGSEHYEIWNRFPLGSQLDMAQMKIINASLLKRAKRGLSFVMNEGCLLFLEESLETLKIKTHGMEYSCDRPFSNAVAGEIASGSVRILPNKDFSKERIHALCSSLQRRPELSPNLFSSVFYGSQEVI